jgi:pimeloyl-ACP methyl ester carboxylesterase
MRQRNYSTSELVILVAGAGNLGLEDLGFGLEKLSTAMLHMWPVWRQLGGKPGRHVAEPIVPGNFGLGNLPWAARKIEDKVLRTIDEHPNARVKIVGHSLGGLIGARVAFRNPEAIDEVVAAGSPFGGVRSWVPQPWRSRYAEFANEVLSLQGDQSTDVTSVASRFDQFVSVESALAVGPKQQYVTRWNTHNTLVTASTPVDHILRAVNGTQPLLVDTENSYLAALARPA